MAEFDITYYNPGTNRTSEFRIAYMNEGQTPLISQDKLINYVILGEDHISADQLDTFSVHNIESISLRRRGNIHYCKFCPYTSSRKRYMRFHRDSLHKDRVRKAIAASDDDQTADSLVNLSANCDNSESECCTRVSDVSKSSSSESPEKELYKLGEKSDGSCSSCVLSELYLSETEQGGEGVKATASPNKSKLCSVSEHSFSEDSERCCTNNHSSNNPPLHETSEHFITRLQHDSPHQTIVVRPKLHSRLQSKSESASNNNSIFEAPQQKKVESKKKRKRCTNQTLKRTHQNDSFVRIMSRRRKSMRRIGTCRLSCCDDKTQHR